MTETPPRTWNAHGWGELAPDVAEAWFATDDDPFEAAGFVPIVTSGAGQDPRQRPMVYGHVGAGWRGYTHVVTRSSGATDELVVLLTDVAHLASLLRALTAEVDAG